MTVSFTWPPPKDGNKAGGDDDSSSNNDSFSWPPRNNHGSDGSSLSPQKNLRKQHHHHTPNNSESQILSGEVDMPRMQLFDSKAEITYIEEEDDLAASVYGDRRRNSVASVPKPRKEGVSGYDFGNLLKERKTEYNPWGSRKSCRF
mmetsp:Transcript_36715/g.56980  ORF Transcript_36715/g.56980 Transcript_36715/m.56980 type:complete len:146 (+) Transcript_36715:86-523(+)